MIYHKKCAICPKEFDTDVYNKTVCSEECAKIKLKNRKRATWDRKREKKQCIICNKIFDATHSKINVCSEECRKEKKRRIDAKFYNKDKNLYIRRCKICKTNFETTNKWKYTCSDECKEKNRKNNLALSYSRELVTVEAICPGCGCRHKKKILATSVSNVTPRYFCPKHPYCIANTTGDRNYSANYYGAVWQTENRGYI